MDATRRNTPETKQPYREDLPTPAARGSGGAPQTLPPRTPPTTHRMGTATGGRSRAMGRDEPVPRRSPGDGRGTGYGSGPNAQRHGAPAHADSFWDFEATARNNRLTTAASAEDLFALPTTQNRTPSRLGEFGSKAMGVLTSFGDKQRAERSRLLSNLMTDLGEGNFGGGSTVLPNKNFAELRKAFKAPPYRPSAEGGQPSYTNEETAIARAFLERLDDMSVGEVEAIHAGAEKLARAPGCDALVTLMRDVTGDWLRNLNPALSPVLQRMLRAIGDPPGPGVDPELSATHRFNEALQFASEKDASRHDQTKHVNEAPYEVVLDALAYMMSHGMTAEDTRELMRALPAGALRQLAEIRDIIGHGTMRRADMVKFAKDALDGLRGDTLSNFESAVDEASNWRYDPNTQALEDPAGFAASVIRAAGHLSRFQACGGVVAPATLQMTDLSLGGNLALLMHPGNLAAVPLPQLQGLSEAMRLLGLKGDFGLAEAIDRRRSAAADVLKGNFAAMTGVLENGATQEPIAIVQSIQHALGRWAADGARHGDFLDGLRRFLAVMPESQRTALAQAMNSDAVMKLGAVLTEVSRATTVKDYVNLSRELDQIALVLSTVRDTLHPGMTAKMEGSWPTVDDLPQAVSTREMTALLSAFQIKMFEGELVMTLSVAPLPCQQAIDGTVKAIRTPEAHARLALDAPRTTYQVRARSTSVEEIEALAHRQPRVLAGLAQVLSPATWGAVDGLTHTTQTPFRIGSRPVEYLGEPAVTFNINSDGRGGLNVDRTFEITQVRQARVIQSAGGDPMFVNMLKPPTITTRMNISSTGYVTSVGAAQVSNDFSMIDWDKPYPRPLAVQEIFVPGADARMQQDFIAYLASEYSTENSNFLLALNAFDVGPSYGEAVRLLDMFVSDKAQEQVNVSNAVRINLQAALQAPGADALSGPELIELLAPARTEVFAMLGKDTFKRYMLGIMPVRTRPLSVPAARGGATEVSTGPDSKREGIARGIATQIRSLAARRDVDNVDGKLGLLRHAMGDNLDHPEYWSELRLHLANILPTLTQEQLVLLLVNIDRAADPDNARHIGFIHETIRDVVHGTRLGRMNLEGVLAENARHLTVARLHKWFENAAITEHELFTALKRLEPVRLQEALRVYSADGRFKAVATRVTESRQRELDTVKASLLNLIARTSQVRALQNSSIATLTGVALTLTQYADLRVKLADPSAGTDRELDEARQQLSSWLTALLKQAPGPGLTAATVLQGRVALEMLGATGATIDNAVLQLQSREMAQRDSKQVPASAAARIPPGPPR